MSKPYFYVHPGVLRFDQTYKLTYPSGALPRERVAENTTETEQTPNINMDRAQAHWFIRAGGMNTSGRHNCTTLVSTGYKPD